MEAARDLDYRYFQLTGTEVENCGSCLNIKAVGELCINCGI